MVQLRRALTEVRAEVGTIRDYLETVKADAQEATLPAGKRDVLRFLRGRGVREEHARELCGRVDGLTDVPRAMLDGVTVREGGRDAGKAVMLIGPTGVGKTTTIAKLAAAATQAGLRAAIVSLDSYRIGALEQIRIYSKIMGVPLEIAPDARRVKACVERHADKDVVFIDTTGRNPMSVTFLSELSPIYEAGIPVETHLLVSATCDYDFVQAAWKAYSRLPVDYVGITKVDEAVKYGALYNVAALLREADRLPHDRPDGPGRHHVPEPQESAPDGPDGKPGGHGNGRLRAGINRKPERRHAEQENGPDHHHRQRQGRRRQDERRGEPGDRPSEDGGKRS